ncbi:MAG: carboxyl transferase domain-containing protein, partial [Acidimicrobiales bacterium]
EHVDGIVDPNSFVEINGTEGGQALIDGRPVIVGPSSELLEWALARRQPYIALISGPGGALRGGPRDLGLLDPVSGMSSHFSESTPAMFSRQRGIPVVAAIVHHSFGNSTFFTSLCDFVVQLEGTCMAMAGPRVLAIGTGEKVTMEELGGAGVHRNNGQTDEVADSLEVIYGWIRKVLSYLPSASGAPLPVRDLGESSSVAELANLSEVHQEVLDLVAAIVDQQTFFELKADYCPGLVTGFAFLGGIPVGVIANDPSIEDGSFSPEACLKATRHVCMCDAFGLPIVLLLDTPGMTGEPYGEREAPISRAMMLAQAVHLAATPKCFVVVRRAFGPGLLVTGSARVGTDLVIAWPGARIGFSDGAALLNGSWRVDLREWVRDGVIEPSETRATLIRHLRSVLGDCPIGPAGPLSAWPVGF